MNKKYNKLTFIGIETSCDETAVSVVRLKPNNTGTIFLSEIISKESKLVNCKIIKESLYIYYCKE